MDFRLGMIGASLAALVVAPSALACSCVCPDKLSRAQISSKAKERLAGVDVAFEGEVLSAEWFDGPNESRFARVQLKPTAIAKGDLPDQTEIIRYISSAPSMCEVTEDDFEAGWKLRVFAQSRDVRFPVSTQERAFFDEEDLFDQNRTCDCDADAVFHPSFVTIPHLRERRKR